MKSLMAAIAVAFVGSSLLLGAPDPNYHTRAYGVTAVAPIVVQDLTKSGFVVGSDGIARTCPNVKNVSIYIRGEWKNAPLVFAYVNSRSVIIISTPERPYTLACLKVE